ncbi:chorismate mutase [Bifidobacterium magnum]|uniref:Chorismate mutase n=1 Tax=Bifidobacterium magnum TaxID=1692 RepID=A0A087BEU2_9BIFI|nr:chorismate mutase [Bifidobacterium magnum]KFI69542.1 Chorismate mutase [Bifidobacterium magnum]
MTEESGWPQTDGSTVVTSVSESGASEDNGTAGTAVTAGCAGNDANTIADEAAAQIERLRSSIDNIDMAIVAMLAQRFEVTRQVGQWKARAGFDAYDPQREDAQLARMTQLAHDTGLDPHIARQYLHFVADAAKERHRSIAREIADE